MGIEKLPLSTEIPWNEIKEVRVSRDGSLFSFEFELRGKKKKVTIGIGPGETTYAVSRLDGSPIVHATQKGRELSVIDFSSTPSRLPKWVKGLQTKQSKSGG